MSAPPPTNPESKTDKNMKLPMTPTRAAAIAGGLCTLWTGLASAHDDPIGVSHNLFHDCAQELNNTELKIDRGIPAGQTSAVVPSRFTGAAQLDAEGTQGTCAGLNWVRLYGRSNLRVRINGELGRPPNNAHDCSHSALGWALYAEKTNGSWAYSGGGFLYGNRRNGVCYHDGQSELHDGGTDWGTNDLTNGVTNSTGQYRLAFTMWQHNDVDVGHPTNYCSDPESCFWPVSLTLSNTFSPPKQDFTIWRPSTGTYWHKDSSTGSRTTQAWGKNGDVPVTLDFDGDSQSDYAVFRPSNGTWHVLRSSNNTSNWWTWGQSGDVTATADFDGDARDDLAVWRPSNGRWYWINSSTWTPSSRSWGQSGDIPAPGDFTGDGRADHMVWRPSNGTWYLRDSTTGSRTSRTWGVNGDIPAVGDYDGDHIADRTVWRPSNGKWYYIRSSTGAKRSRTWGKQGDIPVPGDYDQDGKTDFTFWRPADGRWWYVRSSNNSGYNTSWGQNGDTPVAAHRY